MGIYFNSVTKEGEPIHLKLEFTHEPHNEVLTQRLTKRKKLVQHRIIMPRTCEARVLEIIPNPGKGEYAYDKKLIVSGVAETAIGDGYDKNKGRQLAIAYVLCEGKLSAVQEADMLLAYEKRAGESGLDISTEITEIINYAKHIDNVRNAKII